MPISRLLTHAVLLTAITLAAPAFAEELDDINRLAEQGKTALALDRLNSYLQTQPKNAKALFLKGVLLAETEKRDEAIKVFTDLTEKYPQLPAPYNNLAVLYAYQGHYDKARNALESAIRTHPSYATAHENLGDIYARMASEAYGRALQLDTGNTRAQSKLALIKDLLPAPDQTAGNKSALNPAAVASKTETRPVSKAADTVKMADATKTLEISKSPTSNKPVDSGKPGDIKTGDTKTSESKPAETPAVKAAETTPTAKDATPSAKASEPAVPNASEQAIRDAVTLWSQAWASQDVEQYLASYAKEFKTPGGESRASWESTRRERVSKPARIEITLSNVQLQLENKHQARVRFTQFYHAGSLSQRTSKQLVMVQQQGRWLIQQESANR